MASLSRKILGMMGTATALLAATTLVLSLGMKNQAGKSAESANLATEDLRSSFDLLEKSVQANTGIMRLLRLKDPDALEKELAEFQKIKDSVEKNLQECGAECESTAAAFKGFTAAAQTVTDQVLRGEVAESQETVRNELNPAFEKIALELQKRNSAVVESITADQARTQKEIGAQTLFYTLFGVLAAIGLMAISWWVATKKIIAPMNGIRLSAHHMAMGDFTNVPQINSDDEIGALAQAFATMAQAQRQKIANTTHIANGDLTQNISIAGPKDALGEALQKMNSSLRTLISNLQATAFKVNEGSQQIGNSTQAMSQSATEQAAALEQISSTMHEIEGHATDTLKSVSNATKTSSETKEGALRAERDVHELVEAMQRIQNSSKQVSKVLHTIDEIAFQTNLLALNAAVEAARAGKAGKGFAVVAEEVRSLAGRSAKAAHETEALIQESEKVIEAGAQAVQKASAAMGEIAHTAAASASELESASTTIKQQTEGVHQVSQALQQIETAVQQNTAGAEEVASVVREFDTLVGSLTKEISAFKTK